MAPPVFKTDEAEDLGLAGSIPVHLRHADQSPAHWGGEADCCINSWTLSNGLWLGADVDGLVDWFLAHRPADGGWNCEWVDRSAKSSFHSTLNTLKGLVDYERVTGDRERVRDARRTGESICSRAGCTAGCRRASRLHPGRCASRIHFAGSTAC